MNSVVLSGTGTIVPSGTGLSCYRGPESSIPRLESKACGTRNLSNQNSYGILLTHSAVSTIADTQGYAGLEDGVDYHWGELFKAAALSTLLSIGSQAGSSDEESEIVRALRQGAGDSISQTGQQIVSRQLNIAPTLTIRPGFPVRLIVPMLERFIATDRGFAKARRGP